MKALIIALTILMTTNVMASENIRTNLVIGGWSKHIIGDHYKAGNGYNGSDEKQHTGTFNDTHGVLGLSFAYGDYRLSVMELTNSYYQNARAIEVSYNLGGYSVGTMVSSGYANTDGGMFGDYAIMPTVKYESKYWFAGVFGVAALAGFTVPLGY